MKGKGLYRGAYRASMALRALRPWRWLRPDDLVSVRVPRQELPVVVTMTGSEDGDLGLTLVRGPRALEHAYLLLGGAAEAELDPIDLLSLSFSPFDEVPPSRRRFLSRARLRPGEASFVPCLLVKRPGEQPLELDDEDVEVVRIVVRGLVEAIGVGLIGPTATRGEGSLGVVPLSVSMEGSSQEVAVSRDDIPSDSSPPPRLDVDRDALTSLPRLRFSWIVGCPLMPFVVDGSDEVARMLVVVEKGTGRLIDGLTVSGPRWAYAAASRFLDLLSGSAGKAGPKGLPTSVLSASKPLADLLGPELRFVGVECRHDPDIEGQVGDAADELAARIAEQSGE